MAKQNRKILIPEVSIDVEGVLNLEKLIEKLTTVKEHVPIDYWDSIEMENETDYDSSYISTNFWYSRPETESEEKTREESEAVYSEQLRNYKRQQLERLKKELGE